MDKKLVAWGTVNIALCTAGIILAIFGMASKWTNLSTVGMVLSVTGMVGSLVMLFYSTYKERPWRSGSYQYQKLKHATFAKLKSNLDDEVRIRQAFYIGAETCGVVQNIYCKDFELMKRVAEECTTKKKHD